MVGALRRDLPFPFGVGFPPLVAVQDQDAEALVPVVGRAVPRAGLQHQVSGLRVAHALGDARHDWRWLADYRGLHQDSGHAGEHLADGQRRLLQAQQVIGVAEGSGDALVRLRVGLHGRDPSGTGAASSVMTSGAGQEWPSAEHGPQSH